MNYMPKCIWFFIIVVLFVTQMTDYKNLIVRNFSNPSSEFLFSDGYMAILIEFSTVELIT